MSACRPPNSFGSSNDRRVRKYQPRVDAINALEPEIVKLTDEQLRARTDMFKKELARARRSTTSWCRRSPPARGRQARHRAAAFRRAARRRHDPARGQISEMKTGEGKTLVGRSRSISTRSRPRRSRGHRQRLPPKRDSEWMGQIHAFLGLKTGVIVHGLDDEQRKPPTIAISPTAPTTSSASTTCATT